MQGLNAYHNSREPGFRTPFGAVKCGAEVTLCLHVWGEAACEARAVLRTWNGYESFYPGESYWENGTRVFVFRIKAPDKPCVLWYNFRLSDGNELYYVGAKDGALRSGESIVSLDIPHDFRITVYDPAFDTPAGFKGRIAYQIFPDRFYRGDYPGVEEGILHHRRLGRRVTVKDWGEEVDYLPRGGEKYYSPQDYYLGNFRGVIDKIPYLKSLGVGVVYMNPIFESAYNHRYSISDYMSLDPLLGTEEDFKDMVSALHAAGMKLILDGVFSHTGDDSIYFDRHGYYGGGAFGNKNSPYREWYDFSPRWKHGFRCWWDFETLPEVEELTPSYMEFAGRVIEKWIGLGADGWRLDVADELPDEFIKFLRKRLKAIAPEAILIGEVWEDAALKKDGFGTRREYVNGLELDGVMDYPFSDAVLDFLLMKSGAAALKSQLGAQLEGYPKCFMETQLGLLGSHDMPRVLSIFAGGPRKNVWPRETQAVWRPSADAARLAKKRLMQASALQFAMPFMPCIYYGDEAGLTGLADPFCRRPFPWGNEDAELMEHYRMLTALRNNNAVFAEGRTSFAAPQPEVFAMARSGDNEAIVIVNRRGAKRIRLFPAQFSEGEARPRLSGCYSVYPGGGEAYADGMLELDIVSDGFLILISK